MQVTRAVATVSAAATNATATRVDVGGYQFFIRCTGQGSPTVVLDADAGGDSTVWRSVEPEVARFAHVCVYTAPTTARATRDRFPTPDSG